VTVEGERKFFAYAEAKFVRQLFDAIPDHQLLPTGLDMDSLDVVELVMKFEEELERAE
jgi:acyl carrier protein